jgi:hypothetical protein
LSGISPFEADCASWERAPTAGADAVLAFEALEALGALAELVEFELELEPQPAAPRAASSASEAANFLRGIMRRECRGST